MTLQQYYADVHVRARILEYLGGGAGCPTAAYLATLESDGANLPMWEGAVKRPASAFDDACGKEADISRSFLDSEGLIFLFELDYLNPDASAEPFTHPAEVFFKLEPAFQTARRVMESFGVPAYALVTGRGYHFTGRIPIAAPVFAELADVAPATPAWIETMPFRREPGLSYDVTPQLARAWAGLGCVVEHLAHLVTAAAQPGSIPLVFNGTRVGTGLVGRECVSIDFSHAGDPLDARYLRCAFSAYQWHRFRPDIFGAAAGAAPPLAAVPRGRRALLPFLRAGRSLEAGRRAARRGSAVLPDISSGIGRLLTHYLASPLAAFHQRFHAGRHAQVPGPTPDHLPPCARACLDQPNDLLLRPEHLQHLVRTLIARGWTAARVADLVESIYRADHGWGDRWRRRMDPATRAEFDVRVFAGMIATGADGLIDFNCVSAQEKGLCPRTGCDYDLRRDAERLSVGAMAP